MGRQKKYTEGDARKVAELRSAGQTWGQIAQATGIPRGTASQMRVVGVTDDRVIVAEARDVDTATARPADSISSNSLKTRLLREIARNGPYDDIKTLTNDARRPGEGIGGHEVMHLLYALSKEGTVVFSERRNAKRVTRIRATTKGMAAAGYNGAHGAFALSDRPNVPRHVSGPDRDYRTHSSKAVGGPIERSHVAPQAPETAAPIVDAVPLSEPDPEPSAPVQRAYPELERLRERIAAGRTREQRLDALLQAAEALSQIDPNAAADLRHRAERVAAESPSLTALEAEYLAYAEEHS